MPLSQFPQPFAAPPQLTLPQKLMATATSLPRTLQGTPSMSSLLHSGSNFTRNPDAIKSLVMNTASDKLTGIAAEEILKNPMLSQSIPKTLNSVSTRIGAIDPNSSVTSNILSQLTNKVNAHLFNQNKQRLVSQANGLLYRAQQENAVAARHAARYTRANSIMNSTAAFGKDLPGAEPSSVGRVKTMLQHTIPKEEAERIYNNAAKNVFDPAFAGSSEHQLYSKIHKELGKRTAANQLVLQRNTNKVNHILDFRNKVLAATPAKYREGAKFDTKAIGQTLKNIWGKPNTKSTAGGVLKAIAKRSSLLDVFSDEVKRNTLYSRRLARRPRNIGSIMDRVNTIINQGNKIDNTLKNIFNTHLL